MLPAASPATPNPPKATSLPPDAVVVNVSPPPPADPNEPYIFKPAPIPAGAQGVVTLDHLYQLSRSL